MPADGLPDDPDTDIRCPHCGETCKSLARHMTGQCPEVDR